MGVDAILSRNRKGTSMLTGTGLKVTVLASRYADKATAQAAADAACKEPGDFGIAATWDARNIVKLAITPDKAHVACVANASGVSQTALIAAAQAQHKIDARVIAKNYHEPQSEVAKLLRQIEVMKAQIKESAQTAEK